MPVRILPAVVPSHFVPFRSVLPLPGLRPATGPFLRAYRACEPVPARARFAPARFARLIARAREADAGHTSPFRFSTVFSRRREPGGKAAPRGHRFLPSRPISAPMLTTSSISRKKIWIREQRPVCPQPSPWPPPVPERGSRGPATVLPAPPDRSPGQAPNRRPGLDPGSIPDRLCPPQPFETGSDRLRPPREPKLDPGSSPG